jgi:peptidoglycan glycosyltransferase
MLEPSTKLDKRIKWAFLIIAGSFLLLIGNISYLTLFQAESILNRPENTRPIREAQKINRGVIVTADQVVLAKSQRYKTGYKRVYPKGSLAAHIIGFYSWKIGASGIERAYNRYLSGYKNINSWSDWLKKIIEGEQRGYDVVLTIDSSIQQITEQAMKKVNRGAALVLNPKTGDILALVSRPSYEPDKIEKDWQKIKQDPNSPLLNRATQGLYPPGSTFKIITLAAAIDLGLVTPQKVYRGPAILKIYGGRVTNFAGQGYGTMPLHRAFALSVNTIFAQIGLEIGGNRLVKYAQKFGFNQDIQFAIDSKRSQIPASKTMDKLEVAWTAVGQGRLLVTPLQMALVTSAIANKGKIMQPKLIKEIRTYDGRVVKKFKPRLWLRPLSGSPVATIKDLMVEVVKKGTGRRALLPHIKVAGKTGTAESQKKRRPHAWFLAFAPAQDPQIVVTVLVENGGQGGKIAAPIAKQILKATLEIRENSHESGKEG